MWNRLSEGTSTEDDSDRLDLWFRSKGGARRKRGERFWVGEFEYVATGDGSVRAEYWDEMTLEEGRRSSVSEQAAALDRILEAARTQEDEALVIVKEIHEGVLVPSEDDLAALLWAKSLNPKTPTLSLHDKPLTEAAKERDERLRRMREGIMRIGPM